MHPSGFTNILVALLALALGVEFNPAVDCLRVLPARTRVPELRLVARDRPHRYPVFRGRGISTAGMAQERLSFKEMCARFDVTARTLRYYEYIELLSPERVGRARFYSTREIARMTLIIRGRKFGFSLEEIRQWLLLRDQRGTEAQMRALVDASTGQLEKLDAQIAELQAARDDLAALCDELRETLG